MINRKHIDHADLLQLGKLLLLLTKRQQIKLNFSSERNKRMTEVEKTSESILIQFSLLLVFARLVLRQSMQEVRR